MENNALSAVDYLRKAERYCASAERCASQVRLKLQQWDCPQEEWEDILDRLYQNGYLDDLRFARAYAHDKLLYHGWGHKKIEVMLGGLHLPSEAIHTALREIDANDYSRILRKVAGQKRGATREQKIRFLMQRGFLYDEVVKVIG